MNITLHTGTTTATITTDGAYITSLADERGDVFYPLQQLTAPDGGRKTRGGCHVCPTSARAERVVWRSMALAARASGKWWSTPATEWSSC